MEDIHFETLEELYQRLLPALRSKKKLLRAGGFKSIDEHDIWEYLVNNKWNDSYGLELCDIVDDVLNIDDTLIVDYFHSKETKEEKGIELPKLK